MNQLAVRTPDRRTVDELAECLERFLTARADEATMERAQLALARWRSLLSPGPAPGDPKRQR